MVQTNRNDKTGVIKQLHNMLTNHPERMHSMLNVSLISKGDNTLLARDEFEIYTNHPEQKIKDKVEKLKTKGGITTLMIKELVEKTEGNYLLILSV